MSKRAIFIFAGVLVLAVVLVILGVVSFDRVRDPVYKGKPLSQHLLSFSEDGLHLGGVTMNAGEPTVLVVPHVRLNCTDPMALEAIRAVGTNALPLLVRMLGSGDSRLKRWIWSTVAGNRVLRTLFPISPPTRGWMRQIGALGAFRELGQNAAPAIPMIVPLLEDPECAPAAVVALLSIHLDREEDILALTNALHIRTAPASGGSPSLVQSTAILALSTFGLRASNATPVLLDCLSSTNGRLRGSAAIALSKIGCPAEKVLPAILASLSGTKPPPLGLPPVSSTAASLSAWANQERHRHEVDVSVMMLLLALKEYGSRAQMALPMLTNLQAYPLENVQTFAKEIAAELRMATSPAAE